VYTASAGNMAQGVAWGARELGIPCTVLTPDTAARTKLDAIERLGARVIPLSFDEWWSALVDRGRDGVDGTFVHPVSDRQVIAGNATVGLEIAEQLGDVDEVFVPYGGGGLSCGIALALRERMPRARVYACEIETAAPLAASLRAGAPVSIAHRPSWVSGIGGKSVLAEMWPLASHLLAGSRVVSLAAAAAALRTLVERAHVVAEGAGAVAVAAALDATGSTKDPRRPVASGVPHPASRVVCVISGGNIDVEVLARILREEETF
jgi:threonine dehydratase